MANMALKKNPMPTQDPAVRAHNFSEVALGYTEQMAIDEALRCLNCKNMPCVSGCPVKIHIPEFIGRIKEGDFEGAYQVITKSSSLPAVCGRVCPQEVQCESKCVRGLKGESVGIGRLERFVADWHNTFCTDEPVRPESNGHRVAVVGSGPSGLTCAGDLAKKGYEVTVSMNPIMIDGTGMCGGCRLTLNVDGKRVTKFACVDGPDFNGYEIDFDEAMVRGRMYSAFERHKHEEACNLFNKEVK